MDIVALSQNPAVTLVTAKRGHGKTTVLKELLFNTPRFSVFDTVYEYDARVLNAVVCRTTSDVEYCLRKNEPRIIFQPVKMNENIFEYWCALHYELGMNYLMLVSEVNRWYSSAKNGEYSSMILDLGRHKNLGLIGDCRRVIGMNKLFLAQCSNFVLGRMFLPEDYDYLSEFLPEEVLLEVSEVEQFEFVVFHEPSREFEKIKLKK